MLSDQFKYNAVKMMKNQTPSTAPRLQMVDHYKDGRPMVLADIDESQDFSELDYLISKLAGPYCKSIEFNDDNRKHGCRCLEYLVVTPVYNGAFDPSETDGRDAGDVREIIWVAVHEEMDLELIARLVTSEVRGIEGNIFA